ncbi:MAG: GTPase Era [Halobacteriovoraceae bacterium]|nr:GTPase Era [Halobacteriovoraceae bacterium]MCB9094236.1 GTPase Era [Halobacteriovoraceae bacterium]
MFHNQHPHNKSIMMSVLGKPNAGKSTLINYLLGFDLSIVSHKPQTTRNSFHCAFTVDDRTEIVLVDSPGVHKSSQELNLRMIGQAQAASEGADLNLIMIDASEPNCVQSLKELVKCFEGELGRSWLIFNKTDRLDGQNNWEELFEQCRAVAPFLEKSFALSAKTGESVHELIGAICDAAPEGPHLYPAGDVSNKNMRFFVTEYIREQAFRVLEEELPYELAVTIDEFTESKKPDAPILAKISATILVNRPSQRAIVVGRKGSVIKEIGMKARKKIEALMGGQVHLNLHVKVSSKWFKNNFILEELGLPRVRNSHRVWRKQL